MARPSILPVAMGRCGTVKVTCMHGDAQEVATAHVKIEDKRGKWKLTIGVFLDLPILLGQDWPGFSQELPAT